MMRRDGYVRYTIQLGLVQENAHLYGKDGSPG